MNFLKKLFTSKRPYMDKQGIYFHVQCRQCQAVVRSRIDKQHDLNRDGDGFIWHKTIVDSRCFRQMRTVVRFNDQYQVIGTQIDGGEAISAERYEAISQQAKQEALANANASDVETSPATPN